MKRIVHILLLLSISAGLFAQEHDHEPADTIKIRQWRLSEDFTEEVSIPFDTVFSLCHRYRISDRYSPLNASLGNYGLPFYQINFFDRIFDPEKFLYTGYYPFMFHPDNAVFMNTRVPFTEMVWTFGTPRETSEQTFRVRHSQNINRFFNFGLIYDIIYSLGQYDYQRSEDKTFTFYSSYTWLRYKAYFEAGINNITSYENGGITDTSQLRQNETTREVPIKLGPLNKANNLLKNRNILLVQRYTLGNPAQADDSLGREPGISGTFSHIFTWENNRRVYNDGSASSGFYDTTFINSSVTFDSLYSRSIKNTIRFDFSINETGKFRLGGGAGLRNEMIRYSQIIPIHDSTIVDTVMWNRSNNVLVGRLYNNIGEKFGWNADGELFLAGYRAGDFTIKGEIVKSFLWEKGTASLAVTAGIINRQPSFWYEQWGSNHFEWHNDLKKEFRIDVGTAFNYPAMKAELKLNYAMINNYTDFNTYALPSQYEEELSVIALMARKEFRAWKFHLEGDVILQKSSNPDILDLPLFSTRSAGFFEHLFRFKRTNGKLNTQLGVDVIYHTLYYPFTYMPATGRFFRQDQVRTGNYPFINVFLNLKIKRTRIFIMFDHVNYGFMDYNYFMIPLYPINIRMLRYGLAWTFYN